MLRYPILVYPGRAGIVRINLPDFGFTIEGKDMVDAMAASTEVIMSLHETRKARGKPLPTASSFKDVQLLKKTKDGFKAMIYVED